MGWSSKYIPIYYLWSIEGFFLTHTIHGDESGIFTDPWMVDFYGKLVGKYTIPIGP